MRVNVPLPEAWPVVDEGPPVVAEVLPGVTLTLGPLEPLPLPAELRAWEDRVVFAGHPPAHVKVGQLQDTKTELGWPVSIFGSDLRDPDTGACVERRIHALYRFEKHGGAAVLRSAHVDLFDSVVDEVLAVLLKAGPDWTTDDPVSIREMYRGLTTKAVGAREAGPGAGTAPVPVESDY